MNDLNIARTDEYYSRFLNKQKQNTAQRGRDMDNIKKVP